MRDELLQPWLHKKRNPAGFFEDDHSGLLLPGHFQAARSAQARHAGKTSSSIPGGYDNLVKGVGIWTEHWQTGLGDFKPGSWRETIGLYDSNSTTAASYHAGLVKALGADFGLLSWWAFADSGFYQKIHNSVEKYIAAYEALGLRWMIFWEDQVPNPEQLQRTLEQFAEWFQHPLYLRHNGRPVVMTFNRLTKEKLRPADPTARLFWESIIAGVPQYGTALEPVHMVWDRCMGDKTAQYLLETPIQEVGATWWDQPFLTQADYANNKLPPIVSNPRLTRWYNIWGGFDNRGVKSICDNPPTFPFSCTNPNSHADPNSTIDPICTSGWNLWPNNIGGLYGPSNEWMRTGFDFHLTQSPTFLYFQGNNLEEHDCCFPTDAAFGNSCDGVFGISTKGVGSSRFDYVKALIAEWKATA